MMKISQTSGFSIFFVKVATARHHRGFTKFQNVDAHQSQSQCSTVVLTLL